MRLYCHRFGKFRYLAIHDGKAFIEFDADDTSKNDHAESIYKGRVTKVGPSFSLIDIGLDRLGLLNQTHAKPHKKAKLHEGDFVIVQIKRGVINDGGEKERGFLHKGVQLTTAITLTTPFFMYKPFESGVRFSSSINPTVPQNTEAIFRLKKITADHPSVHPGQIIFRTKAMNAEDETLIKALTSIHKKFQHSLQQSSFGFMCRGRWNLEKFMDNYTFEAIFTDGSEDYTEAQSYSANYCPRTKISLMHEDVFEAFGVYEAWSEAVETPWMHLPSGGQLLIEHTSILTSIDVNQGHSGSLTQLNKEAAEHLPSLILQRQLSGNMIVDFAGDISYTMKKELLRILTHAMEKSPLRDITHIAWSPLGWLEMRRPKITMSLYEKFHTQ